jgi:type IV pilus assembly protein PilQ
MVKRLNKKTLFLLLFVCAILPMKAPFAGPGQKDGLITLDLKDQDIQDALKIISQASGMNIIIDENVKANTNISLKDVTWQTALDNILKTNGLTYKTQNNIIRVTAIDTVKNEDETLPLSTKIITLNFAKCADLQLSLTKILSSRGNIQTNTATNSLIVTDTPETLSRIEELANKLDIRTPQVMVEALITSVKLDNKNQFGLNFLMSHKLNDEKGLNRTVAQTLSLGDVPLPTNLAINYGKTILPAYNFTALLDFMAQDSRVKILANPKVLTMDNQAAQLEILEQVPYTSVTSESGTTLTTTQYKDTGIKLNVTPHITKDRFISLSVKAEQSFVASYSLDGQPSIDSRKVETNFILRNNETVVIGGLKKKDSTTTIDKTPILGDIPFIGKIFQREIKNAVNEELIIFITPKIMGDDSLSTEESVKLTEIKTDLDGLLGKNKKPALRQALIEKALEDYSKITR